VQIGTGLARVGAVLVLASTGAAGLVTLAGAQTTDPADPTTTSTTSTATAAAVAPTGDGLSDGTLVVSVR